MDSIIDRAVLDEINMKKAAMYRVKAEIASAVQGANAARDKIQTKKALVDNLRADIKAEMKGLPAKRDPKKAEEFKTLSKKYKGLSFNQQKSRK